MVSSISESDRFYETALWNATRVSGKVFELTSLAWLPRKESLLMSFSVLVFYFSNVRHFVTAKRFLFAF